MYMHKLLGIYPASLVEHLFEFAVEGNTLAFGALRCINWFWKAPMDVFEFRGGNIEISLVYLETKRFHVKSSQYVVIGSENAILADSLNLPAVSGTSLKQLNRSVPFTCRSCGQFHHNCYAVRSAQIAKTVANEGIEIFAYTRLGYPWDLFNTDIRENVESTIYEGLAYSHTHDTQKRISGSELQYVEAYADILVS